jgi:hypothetical protein
MLRNKKLAYR